MTEPNFDEISFCRISIVGASGLSLVSARPRRLDRPALEKMLRPEEKLLSSGKLEKPVYFAFDEKLIVGIFLVYMVVTGVWAVITQVSREPFNWLPFISPQLAGMLAQVTPTVVVAGIIVLARTSVRHSSYALTSERLLFFGQYLQTFELSAFESAVVHRNADGQDFLELTVKGGVGPAVVLQFASPGQEQRLLPLLPAKLAVPATAAQPISVEAGAETPPGLTSGNDC